MRLSLVSTLLMLALARAASAEPQRYEYAFESVSKSLADRANYAASRAWEVFDVAFSNVSGYMLCYRRLLPTGSPQRTYAFDLVTPLNADEKANAAARSGWEIYKIVSCSPRLYCLCYRSVRPGTWEYAFDTCPGAQLERRANAAAQKGWELLDLGFGDVSGYLLSYRRRPDPRDAQRYTYTFLTPQGTDLETAANDAGAKGWELFRFVSCLQDRYCLCFRRTSAPAHTYAFQRAAGKNINDLAEQAVAKGWEIYRVVGSPSGDIDYSDAGDLLHSGIPFILCYRR